MMRLAICIVFAATVFSIGQFAGARLAHGADAPVGLLAATCAGCHGPDGNSSGPATPTIARMSPIYFILAMDEYRQGVRNSTIMARIARGYSLAEIQAMAQWFGSRPLRPNVQPFDARLANLGKELHERYCKKCHLGTGPVAGRAGVLIGQWSPYLRASFNDMVGGRRPIPTNMKRWIDRLVRIEGREGLRALFHYYARGR